MNDAFTPDDTRDALRKIGGILLGLAALMIYIRKGPVVSDHPDQWAEFPILLLLVIPAAYLYGSIFTTPQTAGLRVWQAVHSTFGLLFVPLALLQFIEVVGGNPDSSLNTFWVFGATAVLGFFAGAVVGVRVQLLLGSIALIVSWSALWNELLSGGIGENYGVWRGLLGILSIGLLAGALYLWRNNSGDETASSATTPDGDLGLWKASELVTGAGIAAVLACSLGVTSIVQLSPLGAPDITPISTSNLWDILLLAISLGLIGIGSQIGTRGPVYVGSIGLLFFLLIVGLDLNGDPPEPFKMGSWPWILLSLGLAGIVLSFVREASQGDRPRQLVESLRGGTPRRRRR
jgi:hypothetical protein